MKPICYQIAHRGKNPLSVITKILTVAQRGALQYLLNTKPSAKPGDNPPPNIRINYFNLLTFLLHQLKRKFKAVLEPREIQYGMLYGKPGANPPPPLTVIAIAKRPKAGPPPERPDSGLNIALP